MDLDLEQRLTPRVTSARLLDEALTLLRHASAEQWFCGVLAGLPLGAVLLSVYSLVHVVGARPPLALVALVGALAYGLRFRTLSGLSRELLPAGAVGERAACSRLASFKTAMVAGIGSWIWAALLLSAAQSSFGLLIASVPLLCVRGALAPSLLARSACDSDAGLPVLVRASVDTRGQRHLFLGVELLALLGLLLLFGNLYALAALGLLVASSVLGLDVGFVTALLAPDNEIVLLLLLGAAALALEPLRAAISALAFQRARERWEGADLRAAITRLAAQPARRAGSSPMAVARGLMWLGLALSSPALVRADAPDAIAADAFARQEARRILARAEFLPSETESGEGAWRRWLARRSWDRERPDRDASAPPRFELPLPSSALVLGAVLLLLGVGLALTRSLRRRRARGSPSERVEVATASRAERLAHAARLAAEQQYDLGLRGLYAVCLEALDRADSPLTNSQVLERLQSAPLREAFASFTRVFEPCCYGKRPATRADFERAQALTAQVLRAVTDQVPS